MLNVVCGIIRNEEDRIFIAKKAPGTSLAGFWEFPGGKIESGETPESALQRELEEELGMEVEVLRFFGESRVQGIHLLAYDCLFIKADYRLTDHDAWRWLEVSELSEYDLAPADRPFLHQLKRM